jgi:cell division septation protein DedD
MAGILFILALCGVFFLGVMRGQALSRPASDPPSPPRAKVVAQAAPVSRPAGAVTVPAAPAVAVREAPSKPYTIQLVTHRKKELAEAEMNALRAKGYYSFIIPSG